MTDQSHTSFETVWAKLLALPPSTTSRLRVQELNRETPWGKVTLAVGADGSRHVLVPILSTTKVRTGLDGPGLSLRKRVLEDDSSHTTFADLSCQRPELAYLFDDFCADVLSELEGLDKQPLKAVYQVVDRWRSLFDQPVGILSNQTASGIYGELLVLIRLLEVDASAHRLWTGPLGTPHDFVGNHLDIEVKTTTEPTGRNVQVHGLDQLEEPPNGALLLAWYRLKDTTEARAGETLLTLTDQAVALADDEAAVRGLLAHAGYVPGAVESNDARRYAVLDERWYRVDIQFPRLTRDQLNTAGVPETVLDATYTVDLTAEPPAPLTPATVSQKLVAELGGGS